MMKRTRKLRLLICGASLLLAIPARAQILMMHPWGEGIAGVAYLDTVYVHTDNFFFQDGDGISASGYRTSPSLLVNLDGPTVAVRLHAQGDYSDYSLPPGFESSYLDALAEAGLEWRAGTRNRFDFASKFQRSHDPIGTGAQEGQPLQGSTADKWNESYVDGSYRFGAEDAAINVEVGGNRRTRRYTSNRASTQFLDRHIDDAKGVLYFNYSPKTSLLFDVQRIWTRFDETDAIGTSHDADETLYRVGVQWKATAKTSGDIRAGYATRDVKAIPDAHPLFTWAGTMAWVPGARTEFSLGASRALQPSYLPGASYIDSREVDAGWTQQWGARCSTWLTGRFINADFAGTSRNDEVAKIGLKTEYSLVKYLSVIADVEHATRHSSLAPANFAANSAYIGIRLVP